MFSGSFLSDDVRGNAVVLFFVIVFTVGLISFYVVQLNLSAQEQFNREVQHSETIQKDLSQLHTDIVKSSEGSRQASSVQIGFQDRPSTTGTLQLKNFSNLSSSQYTIHNAERVKEYTPYWNGTNHSYPAKYLSYSVDYSQYTTDPSFYIEPSFNFYSEQPAPDKTQLTKKPQQFINGDKINLVTFTGPLDTTSSTRESIEVTPVSASRENIIIQANNSTDPVKFTLPTRINETKWESILQNQMVENGGHISNISTVETRDSAHQIQFTLATNETYELSLSKLHLSSEKQGSTVETQQPKYVDWIGNSQITFQTGGWKQIDIQVRDRYNNPVAGTEVWATANETSQGPQFDFAYTSTSPPGLCEGDFRSASQTCTSSAGDVYKQPGIKQVDTDGKETFIYRVDEATQKDRLIYASNSDVNQVTRHNVEFIVNGSIAGTQFSELLISYTEGDVSVEQVIGGGQDKTNGAPSSFTQFGIDTNNDGAIDIDLLDNIQRVTEQNNYRDLLVELDSNEQINLNDRIIFSYDNVENPSSSGNFTTNITVNNQKTYQGNLTITPNTTPGTLGLCGTPQNDGTGFTSDGSYTHRAVDVSGSEQDVYSGIKFSVTNQENKNVQKVNSFCIASSSEDATAIQYDSTRSTDQYGALLWFDGRNKNGYATTPSTMSLGNDTTFDVNGNIGRTSSSLMKSFEFVNSSGDPVDMRGETVQLKLVYQRGGDKRTDVMQFDISGSEDNN